MNGGSVPKSASAALASVKVPPPIEQLRNQKPADETWQDRLRRAHRGELDRTTLPVYRYEGKQHSLSVGDLERAYVRRQGHMKGYKTTLIWSVCRKQFKQPLVTPRRGVAFWYARGPHGDSVPMGHGGSVPMVGEMPPSCVAGLRSAVANSGLSMHLFAYQDLTNVPAGVHVHDAQAVLPIDIFNDLVAHVPIQCVADLVRARALCYGFGPSGQT